MLVSAAVRDLCPFPLRLPVGLLLRCWFDRLVDSYLSNRARVRGRVPGYLPHPVLDPAAAKDL